MLRSKAFWLGVPGLVFLVWAWGDSFWYWAMAEFDAPGWAGIGSYQGLLYGAKEAGAGVSWGIPEVEYQKIQEGSAWVARLRDYPGIESFIVPHAVVVGVYLLAWAGLVVWRARKYRAELAATEGSDAPADRSGP